MSYEDVKASEGAIRDLCKTNLTTVKICRFLERDNLALGPVGRMQARVEVIVNVYPSSLCLIDSVGPFRHRYVLVGLTLIRFSFEGDRYSNPYT